MIGHWTLDRSNMKLLTFKRYDDIIKSMANGSRLAESCGLWTRYYGGYDPRDPI